ncbi:MAG: FkbM family methyltransferase [bacterium]|nr:FkbM family methyltransferase [bacterium]
MADRKRKIVLFRPVASKTYRQGEVPVQLLAIARMLLNHYDVEIVTAELGLKRKTDAEIREIIASHLDECLFFGVTAMTGYGIRQALDMSRFVREQSPQTKVVWGGWHASLLPHQTLEEAAIDCVVIGQGECTAIELAQALEADRTDLADIDGLGWKRDGEIVLNRPRTLTDINEFPPLPFHLLDDEAFRLTADERTAAFVTSVGCPMNCGFCADRAVYCGRWCGLDPERALEEIRGLRDNHGVTAVRILDSNFFPDWERGIAILRGIHDLGMRTQWINARIPKLQNATTEDLALFRETIDFFLVGAESGSDAALDFINKRQSVESIRHVSRMYADHGVPIGFATIVGVPFDDPEMWRQEFETTIDLLDELLTSSRFLHKAQVHVYTPYPGTPLFDQAVKRGFQPPGDLTGWADVELFTSNLPYLPKGLDERIEFLTTYVLQLLWPKYRFYQGDNPVARAFFGAVQSTLTALARLRWKTRYFGCPVEFRLAKRFLSRAESPAHDASERPAAACLTRDGGGLASLGRRALVFAYRKAASVLAGTGISQVYPLNRLERLLAGVMRSDRVEIDGHVIHLDAGDSLRLSALGTFEPGVTELMKSCVREGDVAIDVGAHIGYFTLLLARGVGQDGRVFAFEPVPANFDLLRKNVTANGYDHVTLAQAAVTDHPGEIAMYLSPEDQVDHHIYATDEARDSISVPCVRLDDALVDFDGQVNVIKMDIQGAEAGALEGMKDTIHRSSRVTLISEFWPYGLANCGADPRAYLRTLMAMGFRVTEINDGFSLKDYDDRDTRPEPVDIDDLLSRFTYEKRNFANLFCVKRSD